jgi:TraX protein
VSEPAADMADADARGFPRRPPRIALADGTVEALKWLALALMTCDHINSYVLGREFEWMSALGRLAMPLFGAVLAYNLARPDADARGRYARTLKKLLLFGALATPPFIAGGGSLYGWWPLNIMFLFAAATACVWLIERGGLLGWAGAFFVFVIGGGLAEFSWPGLALTLALWWYWKRGSWPAAVVALACWVGMYVVNANFWALAAIPVLATAPWWRLRVPRLRLAFYVYYPLHIGVLWAIQRALS